MSLKVSKPGLFTTVQDCGRYGWRKYGVGTAGAMDVFALRVANILVGNREDAAGLEITLMGPEFLVTEETLLAVTGSPLPVTVEGEEVPLWRPIFVPAGAVVRLGKVWQGCRAYLAVAGGIEVPVVMGSRSTYLRAGLGGLEGRQLRAGDVLPVGKPTLFSRCLLERLRGRRRRVSVPSWGAGREITRWCQPRAEVRVIPGSHFAWLSSSSREQFFHSSFFVTSLADRMGYRLQGPKLALARRKEILSEGVAPGTVQVTPAGEPLVLMADAQTTGGYPKIAQVAAVDLSVLAHKKPGDEVRFVPVEVEEAQRLYLAREKDLLILRWALFLRREEEESCSELT